MFARRQRRRPIFAANRPSRNRRPSLGAVALAVSMLALFLSFSGVGAAAEHAVKNMVDGHPISSKPTKGGILLLGADRKFPAAAIPTTVEVDNAEAAKVAKTATTAAKLGTMTATQLSDGCPQGTADLGTWCLMWAPYPLTTAEVSQGVNNYFWASQACVTVGGFLPDAAQLIGAAKIVHLESVLGDNPATATVQGGDASSPNTPQSNQREMSASLVTTAAGSDAAGSEGVSAATVVAQGQPQPAVEPAVPEPSTLQYVTVYSNGTAGGFAGSEPVSSPENFRCGFYLKQGGANQTVALPSAADGATVTTADTPPSS